MFLFKEKKLNITVSHPSPAITQGHNTSPFHCLPPWHNINLNKLKTIKDLKKLGKIHSIITDNKWTKTVNIKYHQTNSFGILKIYKCHHHNQKIVKKNIDKCWIEWCIVNNAQLMEYKQLYYNEDNQQLIIEQKRYANSLTHYFKTKNKILTELEVKVVINHILIKLWSLHNTNFIHTMVYYII